MPPEHGNVEYFDTPARAERLQLLLHLVRNSDQVLYLRAPAGAGKTEFAGRLLGILGDDVATAWIQAAAGGDIVQGALDQLGVAKDGLPQWPDAALNAARGQDLLAVVDDADGLEPAAVEQLAALHAKGGRILLLGCGGLAQVDEGWAVQRVDLPEFDLSETANFLRRRAGEQAAGLSDDAIAALHREAQGLPGRLLEGLHEVLSKERGAPPARPEEGVRARVPLWLWVGGGLIVSLLLAVLVFQDPINALFEAGEPYAADPPVSGSMPSPVERALPVETVPLEPATALPPRIDLPELTRPRPARPPPLVPGLPTEAFGQVDLASSEAPRDAPQAVRDDLLDSMLQDALVAAESQPPGAQAPLDREPQQMQGVASATLPAPVPRLGALDGAVADSEAVKTTAPRAPAVLETEVLPIAAELPSRSIDQGPEAAPTQITPDLPAVAVPLLPGSGPAGLTPVAPTAPRPGSISVSPLTPTSSAVAQPRLAEQAPAQSALVRSKQDVSSVTPRKPEAASGSVASPVPPPADKGPVREGPAPVEERTIASPVKRLPAVPEKVTTAAEPSAPIPAKIGLDWLRARPPSRFTLQLVGARDRASVEKFVRDNRVPAPYAVFQRQLDGRPWYSLVAGDYPNRGAAVAARARLPKRLERSGVWPRTFGSIQKNI